MAPRSGAPSPSSGPPGSASSITAGAKVEYWSNSYGKWIPATVEIARDDGSFRLLSEDGSLLKDRAPKDLVRPVEKKATSPRNSPTGSAMPQGPVVTPAPSVVSGAPGKRNSAAGPPGPPNPPGYGQAGKAPAVSRPSLPKAGGPSVNGMGVRKGSESELPPKLYVGDRVRIKGSNKEAKVLYVGRPSHWMGKERGDMVGLQLDTQRTDSSCDGKAPNGERLFRCPSGFGMFLPIREVEALEAEGDEEFRALPAPKEQLNVEGAFGERIGQKPLEEAVLKLRKQIEVQKKRESVGVYSSRPIHFCYRGGHGTGMSTVSSLIAQLLRDQGVVSSGSVVEASRATLIAGCGSSSSAEKKCSQCWEAATGGMLLINDAHQLHNGDKHDDAGLAAVSWLTSKILELQESMAKMTADGQACWPQPVCVAFTLPPGANLHDEMKQLQLTVLDFPEFSEEELASILVNLAVKKKFRLDPDLSADSKRLKKFVQQAKIHCAEENIHLAAKVLEDAIGRQTERVSLCGTSSLEGLTTLLEEDFTDSLTVQRDTAIKEALARLDSIVGLDGVKGMIKALYAQLRIEAERREAGVAAGAGSGTLHMVFTGNPGTGKTTVARVVADLLKALGLLRKGHLVEADRSALVAGYSGQTALKTKAILDSAAGGVMLLDEAYALVQDNGKEGGDAFGHEALDTLLKVAEDNRKDLVVILAGYKTEMARLLESNPGLKSRFPTVIDFEDYSVDELLQIADKMLLDDVLMLSASASEALRKSLDIMVKQVPAREHGNGRAVRNMLEAAKRRMAVRLQNDERRGKKRQKAELCTLEASDFDTAS